MAALYEDSFINNDKTSFLCTYFLNTHETIFYDKLFKSRALTQKMCLHCPWEIFLQIAVSQTGLESPISCSDWQNIFHCCSNCIFLSQSEGNKFFMFNEHFIVSHLQYFLLGHLPFYFSYCLIKVCHCFANTLSICYSSINFVYGALYL